MVTFQRPTFSLLNGAYTMVFAEPASENIAEHHIQQQSTLNNDVGRSRRRHTKRYAVTSRSGSRIQTAAKLPSQIGPVPRMLDQLKRRCARLLLTSLEGASSPVQRVPARVNLTSETVRRIVAHWHGRSAFAAADSPVLAATTKMSLLVWCVPTFDPISSTRVVEAWHVIPVTLVEAAQYHHIPVEMRGAMINADLRAHINSKLANQMQ
jgi:hypothetical protein